MLEQSIRLELKDVAVKASWGEDLGRGYIIHNMSLSVGKGQWLSLLGTNGSGKSTLAKVISGFKLPNVEGEVLRYDIDAEKPIPIVLQQPDVAMLGSTPWEDVVLMLEQNGTAGDQIPRLAEQALKQAGLEEHMYKPIGKLSGGQKQLTAIAGCLALESPLLVLDEVTAMLHPAAAQMLLERVRELNRQDGVTVIWITQNLEELRTEDRIAVLDNGELVYDGDTAEWFRREDVRSGTSLCEYYGFSAPYCVQVAWELEQLGKPLNVLPITPDQLAAAVEVMLSVEGEGA